ncbi:hypothetical protein [Kangiella marina]|uniref:Uncharacterized protein n=1 Tax=Kangiella marina TaxID=1079178 RepID=A0ABP8ICB2_9GAMM
MQLLWGAIILVVGLAIGAVVEVPFFKFDSKNSIPVHSPGDLLFEDKNPRDLTESKIIRIVFKKELPNEVVFEVTYNFLENDKQGRKVGLWTDSNFWSFSHGKLKQGLNTVTVKSILSSRSEAVHVSETLTFTISSSENKYNNWLDKEVINFNKIWFQCEKHETCNFVFNALSHETKEKVFSRAHK